MKILITGGGGFLGYRLAKSILARGTLADADGKQAAVTQIVLVDTAFPAQTDPRLKCVKGDFTNVALLADAMGGGTPVRCSIWPRSSAAAPKPISIWASK